MAAVNEAIQERRRQALLAEDLRPLGKGQVGGNGDTGPFIAVGEELEEQLSRLTRKRQIAQLVDEHQVEAPIVRQQSRKAEFVVRQFQLRGQCGGRAEGTR